MLPLLILLAVELRPGGGAAEFRQPQLAAAQGQVAITYGSGSAIYFASSTDGGHVFSPPVKVAETGALALGRHRGPRVTILRDAIVITAIAGKDISKDPHAHGMPEKGELTVWRSIDRGKTWLRTGVINDVPGAAREGLHAIAADPNGNLFAAWLDLREPGTRLYGSRSTDGGRTWSKNALIYNSPDGTICQCCDPAIAIDQAGEIWVMWRNALAGNRDLYVSHSPDGVRFSAAQKLGKQSWALNACPMDGGGLAIDHGRVISAWRRGNEVFLAEPGLPESRLGEGKDVAIALGRKGAYVAWSGSRGVEAQAPGAKRPFSYRLKADTQILPHYRTAQCWPPGRKRARSA